MAVLLIIVLLQHGGPIRTPSYLRELAAWVTGCAFYAIFLALMILSALVDSKEGREYQYKIDALDKLKPPCG